MKRLIDFTRAIQVVSARSGLAIARQGGEESLSAYPKEYGSLEAFVLTLRPALRGIAARLELGQYAADLLAAISSPSDEDRILCSQLAESYVRRGWKVTATIGGKAFPLEVVSTWPSEWPSFRIDVGAADVLLQDLQEEAATELAADLMSAAVALFLCLAAEDRELDLAREEDLPEGARSVVQVNRYERSRAARMACLERYGYRCAACNVLMSERYGLAGRELIHVHHIVPVSVLRHGYSFSPLSDLVPLCPNCHAVAHSEEPPLAVDVIRSMLESDRTDRGNEHRNHP